MISIIIPIYNVAKYVQRCIDSCLQQSYGNFEILTIDDCGTDTSIDIVKAYTDKRINIISHQKNKGLSAARNTGLKYAKGKYVLFLDSDDYIAPQLLKLTVQQAEQDQVDFVSFNSKKVDENGQLMTNYWMRRYAEIDLFNLDINHIAASKIAGWDVAAWSKLIRRSFLLEHNILFDEQQKWFEDHLFSAQLYCLGRFSYLNHTLHYYFQRSEQATQKSITQEKGNQVSLYRSMAMQQVLCWLNDSGNKQYIKIFLPLFIEQYKTILLNVENNNKVLIQVYSLLQQAFQTVDYQTLSSFRLSQVDAVYLLKNKSVEKFQSEIRSITALSQQHLRPWLRGGHCEQLFNYQNNLTASPNITHSGKLALFIPSFILLGGLRLLLKPKLFAFKFRDFYILSRSSLFNDAFYNQQCNISFVSRQSAILHYVLKGEKSLMNPCQQFNPVRYLALNPDLSTINMSLFAHYILYAEMEGRLC